MLVVGASGLVGSSLVRAGRARGWTVTGAARRVRGAADVVLDLCDPDAVAAVVERVRPDVIAIASAWPWVDGCERDPARSLRENVGTVENVLRAAADARVVYYSTDHVFDGERVTYVETDPPSPLNVYARHKRASEELLLARGRALVIRTSWVFGPEDEGKNFVYQVVRAAQAGQTMRLPRGQAGCPTGSDVLAATTCALLEEGVEGIVHVAGEELFTKAEWARTVSEALALGALAIEEVDVVPGPTVAPRPDRVQLRSVRHGHRHGDARAIVRSMRDVFRQ
jgi:dTDP-4-dehydrorhamnose reductase